MEARAPARVLVVDDDPALRELLRDYLGLSGFKVDEADGGEQMRQRIAAAPPDLVVLDIMLPGEDGLSLARALRRQSNLPILMLSVQADIDRARGRDRHQRPLGHMADRDQRREHAQDGEHIPCIRQPPAYGQGGEQGR